MVVWCFGFIISILFLCPLWIEVPDCKWVCFVRGCRAEKVKHVLRAKVVEIEFKSESECECDCTKTIKTFFALRAKVMRPKALQQLSSRSRRQTGI